ncbi:MAG: 1-deoxy-D-xylulose-5-phosphate reductoisomerase [Alphaproteobacteria bacterium]
MALTAAVPATAPRRVTILGSTGSVGCSTVDLIERNLDRFEVEAMSARNNVALLAEQARKLRPRLAVVADENRYGALKEALAGTGIEIAAGRQGVIAAAQQPSDWVMAAIVGAAGLESTLAAVRRGAIVALANKESLVCAGDLVTTEVARSGARLIPVDSEHSAIFQVFDFDSIESIERIILTASGGPFRGFSIEQMTDVTPEQAVAHPNWDMGAKISVDSATMMNKGLEVIEAHYLFGLPSEQIEVLVHPQSVIHSCVAYVDGSVLAQMGAPDMRTPIAYALAWPERMGAPVARLDLAALGQLTFEAPDLQRFPALRLARQALQGGRAAPTILNAANEVAVAAFLGRRIRFLDIARVVETALSVVPNRQIATIADVLEIDTFARRVANETIDKRESP